MIWLFVRFKVRYVVRFGSSQRTNHQDTLIAGSPQITHCESPIAALRQGGPVLKCLALSHIVAFDESSHGAMMDWISCNVLDPCSQLKLVAAKRYPLYGVSQSLSTFRISASSARSAIAEARVARRTCTQ